MDLKISQSFPSSGHPDMAFMRNFSWVLFLLESAFVVSFPSPSVPTSCDGCGRWLPAVVSCSLIAGAFPGGLSPETHSPSTFDAEHFGQCCLLAHTTNPHSHCQSSGLSTCFRNGPGEMG
eukprot:15255084-Heterocapsa_arctica.AAC.1